MGIYVGGDVFDMEHKPMTTIREILRQLINEHPDWDDPEVAQVAIDVASREALIDLVLPVVREVAGNVRRGIVRTYERRVFRPQNARPQNGTGVDPAAVRTELLRQYFFVPGLGRIPWGQATVDDHLARIKFLEGKRDDINGTIAAHHQAIREIQDAGVTCLDEIRAAV